MKILKFSKCWMSLSYNLFSIQCRISAKTWCLVSGSSRKSWWHAPGKIFRVLSSTLLRLTRRGRLCSIPHLALLYTHLYSNSDPIGLHSLSLSPWTKRNGVLEFKISSVMKH